VVFWPRMRCMSRFDAIRAQGGVVRMRGSRVHSAVETVERLGIIHGLVKKI
jgi:hypothetical protein